MKVENTIFIGAILLCSIGFFLSLSLSDAPVTKPTTVSATEFSGERAFNILENLLREGVPHPVGSEANKRVRNRILNWLANEGIKTEVQSDWGCAANFNRCAWSENIIAEIPGQMDAPYVVLMAHYDSVPTAPGAGDDGAGVAAVLEVGRMLKNEGPFRNPIMLLITDAEEAGLLGAEAFFAHHPKNESLGVIFNIEGSGTTGASYLMRTSMNKKTLIDAYAAGASFPHGASLTNEFIKRMPNDTDLSVFQRAQVPGMDFVFLGERNHYHTLNDNLDNIDTRTIQHHGDNVLPLARTFASMDLNQLEDGNLVFQDVYGVLITWPAEYSVILVLIAGLLLLIASIKIAPDWKIFILALVAPLIVVVSCCLFLFGQFKLIDWINGTMVSWPAHELPFRLVLFCTPIVVSLSLAFFFNRFLNREKSLIGLWWFWWALALASIFTLPGAANLLIIPLIVAAILLVGSVWLSVKARITLQMLTLVMVVPVSLGLVLDMEALGYQLIAPTFLCLGLFFTSVLPFIRGSFVKLVIVGAGLLTIGGTVGAISLPLHSGWRPQHVNIQFIQDNDKHVAYWRVLADGVVPEAITSIKDFSQVEAIFPWIPTPISNLAAAEPVDTIAPTFEVLGSRTVDDGRIVDVKMKSMMAAYSMTLVLPASSNLLGYEIGGQFKEIWPASSGPSMAPIYLQFWGVQNQTVELAFHFGNTEVQDAYLHEGKPKLPDAATVLEQARHPLGTPVHQGDQMRVFQKVSF